MTQPAKTSAPSRQETRPPAATRPAGLDLPPPRLLSTTTLQGWAQLRRLQQLPLPLPRDDVQTQVDWLSALYVPSARDNVLRHAAVQCLKDTGGAERVWLGLSGPAGMGKSQMLLQYGIDLIFGERGHDLSRQPNGHLRLPMLYGEASSTGRGYSLTKALCQFARLVPGTSEDECRKVLDTNIPRMGIRFLVDDDAHMWRRVGAASTQNTDSARMLLRLPAVWIFSGLNLESSALMKIGDGATYDSAHQMLMRHHMLRAHPMTLPESWREYQDLIREFGRACKKAMPWIQLSGLHDVTDLTVLLDACDGKHGAIFKALKNALRAALRTPEADLTRDLLHRALPQAPVIVPGTSMSSTLHLPGLNERASAPTPAPSPQPTPTRTGAASGPAAKPRRAPTTNGRAGSEPGPTQAASACAAEPSAAP